MGKTDTEKTYTETQVQHLIAEAIRLANSPQTPTHIHTCDSGSLDPAERHSWPCTSPYCEDVSTVVRRCVEHGGRKPRLKGDPPDTGA